MNDRIGVPRKVVERMAEIDIAADYHTNSGPGMVFCNGCEAKMDMRWYEGRRIDVPTDMKHAADCPAIWAQQYLNK
jgi:hypothetical protein